MACRSLNGRTAEMGRKSDVTECQKGVIACGCPKDYTLKEVVKFASVSTRMVIKFINNDKTSKIQIPPTRIAYKKC